MHDVVIDSLEKQHDLGKRSDTEFKPEAWVYCVAEVQNVYSGKEIIPVCVKLDIKINLLTYVVEKAMERLEVGWEAVRNRKKLRDKVVHLIRYNLGGYLS